MRSALPRTAVAQGDPQPPAFSSPDRRTSSRTFVCVAHAACIGAFYDRRRRDIARETSISPSQAREFTDDAGGRRRLPPRRSPSAGARHRLSSARSPGSPGRSAHAASSGGSATALDADTRSSLAGYHVGTRDPGCAYEFMYDLAEPHRRPASSSRPTVTRRTSTGWPTRSVRRTSTTRCS